MKWMGTALCLLVAGAVLFSLRWTVAYVTPAQSFQTVGIINGMFSYLDLRGTDPTADSIEGLFSDVPRGWSVGTIDERRKVLGWRYLWPDKFVDRRPWTRNVVVPLWIPLLALLLPTLLLWRLDRRRAPPGHCRCGYNLTGLTSARCPECGAPAPAPPPA